MTIRMASAAATACLLLVPALQPASRPAASTARERVVAYEPAAWVPEVWPSTQPAEYPFERSPEIRGLAFTHRWAAYTDADSRTAGAIRPPTLSTTASGTTARTRLTSTPLLPSSAGPCFGPSYEFFAGRDPGGRPIWSRTFADIRPVLAWNNHLGGVTITYDAPLEKFLMCITDEWPGVEDMSTYVLVADDITGPWKLVTYMAHFGRQGYFSNFPSKFISADGRTAWLCYSANFHQKYFANRTKAAPLGSRYAMTLQEVRLRSPR